MTRSPEIIDSHCHLDFTDFDNDRIAVIERAERAGVSAIVIPGVSRQRWSNLLRLCERDGLYPALGLHPVFIESHQQGDLDALDHALKSSPVVAVGEIGLDFYLKELDRNRQMKYCEAQLDLAVQHRLPVILHVRKAHQEMIKLIEARDLIGGIVHAYSGGINEAFKYIEHGFCIGVGGMLTYARSRKLRKLASELPLESLVLETDAPDMPPASHQGNRNSPEYLPECLMALSAVRIASPHDIATATTINTRRVLGITTPLAS
ncbi:MAG: metal-dependent hydrolase [marine bacterium B5-7]|nr:MAG: metal-dependent hydrolase [marine bacterium B5-7]